MTSHVSFVILIVCVFSLFSLLALARGFSNFIDLFKEPSLFHWILQCFFVFIFISFYSFFFLLLALDLFCSFSRFLRYELR